MIERTAMDNSGVGYRSYWVAYFDLLGFENRVKGEHEIWPILEEYEPLLTEIKTRFKEVQCKWFSDTFVFYTPDHSKTSWDGIVEACESFFYRTIEQKIPARGCLSVGDFYAEDDVLVGPALIDAYRLAECQDWLGFVLSPKAVSRCDQYGIGRNHYREYDVPVDHSRSTQRLKAFILSSRFPMCCSPDKWWTCLDEMEGGALDYVREYEKGRGKKGTIWGKLCWWRERNRVLRKYRNSKRYLRRLYPELTDFVQGKYGPIPLKDRRNAQKVS